jgi:hypothetical protein
MMDVKGLYEQATLLFTKKQPLNSLHQEIADQFYVERADFTLTRSIGTDFAAHLMSSYPMQCRRELGNLFSTMLRPTARPWFHVRLRHEDKEPDNETRAWLQWMEETQRRAMYDDRSLFVKATKQGDHDFAAFGQCALSVELNRDGNGLLYRNWHLRDMAWMENEDGQIGFTTRKWKPTAQQLSRLFRKPGALHQDIARWVEKEPFREVQCMHFVVDADMYDDKSMGRPRWSIHYDVEHEHLMEAVPIWGRHYVIPRWQTVSQTQYAYSPATVCALPDGRLLQAMTYTILEAGEKATSPPMIATQNAVRSDVALYAGGITWVDDEYDERLGDALRPLTQDFRGFNFGVEMNQQVQAMLMKAFYLDKLQMPVRTAAMTAYEVAQHVQEYIRNALPLFEPMEMEYNAKVCDETFDLIARAGGFGSPESWPRKLKGSEVDFAFESPLHDAIEQQKGQKFQQASELIAQAISMDASAAFVPKVETALRDALDGLGVPASWMNSEEHVKEQQAQAAAAQQQQQRLAAMEQGSNVAKNLGQSGMVPPPTPASGSSPSAAGAGVMG